jgi:hypothetical protein
MLEMLRWTELLEQVRVRDGVIAGIRASVRFRVRVKVRVSVRVRVWLSLHMYQDSPHVLYANADGSFPLQSYFILLVAHPIM